MKSRIIILSLIVCAWTQVVHAQTFLDHLQKDKANGSVTVTESKEIDDLVNGKVEKEKTVATERKTATTKTPVAEKRAVQEHKEASEHATAEKPAAERKTAERETTESPAVDTRKKVMRGSRKVTGFRVQAFAGGNTRADRVKAEEIGNRIKRRFPDQPVYVHFYSPRWICRVGNYRTQAEASRMLQQIRKIQGCKGACLVKGMISVQY